MQSKAAFVPKPCTLRSSKKRGVFTYFIQDGDYGPIKIGISGDVDKRLRCIQSCNPRQVRLLCAINGDMEMKLHAKFAAFRISGEWFKPVPVLVDFISQLKADYCQDFTRTEYDNDVFADCKEGDGLLTVDQASHVLGIAVPDLDQIRQSGMIRPTLMYSLSELNRFINVSKVLKGG